jgi:acyl-CoA thioester hydrolase
MEPEVTERVVLTEDDIDELGHLNQARYHALLEVARARVLRQGVTPESKSHAFVVVRAELDFLREVRLDDGYVDVRAQITAVGTKSLTFSNELSRVDGIVAARGLTIMVAWDIEARRSRLISDAERAAYGADPQPLR